MSDQSSNEPERGFKWWLRYIIVPVVGSGGVIALIVALVSTPNGPPTPTATPSNVPSSTEAISTQAVLIESIPMWVVTYGGDDNVADVSGGSSRLTVVYDELGVGYLIDYFLPDAGDGYAGIAFKFVEPQDFTNYKFLEVTISFGDEQASCDLFLEDIADQATGFRLSRNIPSTSDVVVKVVGANQVVRIPFSPTYDSVNRRVIKEIGCNANTDFVRGRHTFTVSGTKLLAD